MIGWCLTQRVKTMFRTAIAGELPLTAMAPCAIERCLSPPNCAILFAPSHLTSSADIPQFKLRDTRSDRSYKHRRSFPSQTRRRCAKNATCGGRPHRAASARSNSWMPISPVLTIRRYQIPHSEIRPNCRLSTDHGVIAYAFEPVLR